MRKDWIRTDEERELRRLRNLQKEQRKLNKLVTDHPPLVNLPIVMRKKKRIIPSTTKPVTKELIIERVEPVNNTIFFQIHFMIISLFSRFINLVILVFIAISLIMIKFY